MSKEIYLSKILKALSSVYYAIYLIDLTEDTICEYKNKDTIQDLENIVNGAADAIRTTACEVAIIDDRDRISEFVDLSTIGDRLLHKEIISEEFIGRFTGWFRASFITVDSDDEGRPLSVLFATKIIETDKQREEKLIKISNTDDLTNVYNRRSYDEKINSLASKSTEQNIIIVSVDINGLKSVNDTLGHAAGDELIRGTAKCLNQCLAYYGNVYRMGGDEFNAILFTDDSKMEVILRDFDNIISSWAGKLVDKLSVSYGYCSRKEFPDMYISEIEKIADKRMYEAKSEYYKRTGLDRRKI